MSLEESLNSSEGVNELIKKIETLKRITGVIERLEKKDFSKMNLFDMEELSAAYRLRKDFISEVKSYSRTHEETVGEPPSIIPDSTANQRSGPKYRVTSKDFFGKESVKSGLSYAQKEEEVFRGYPYSNVVKVEIEPGTEYTLEEEAERERKLYEDNKNLLRGLRIPF